MPEESINIFIRNIYSVAIFSVVFLILFIFIFLLSRFLIHKSKKKFYISENMDEEKYIDNKKKVKTLKTGKTEQDNKNKIFNFYLYDLKKDINILRNLSLLGLIFIYVIFFVLLIIFSLFFVTNIESKASLYLILLIVFLIIVITVYAIKGRIIG